MGKKTDPLEMTAEQRQQLETWIRGKTTPQRVVFRAQICLLAADGLPVTDVAQQMSTSRPTVLVWKKRFEEQGPEGLVKDAPRGPGPRKLDEATTEAIIDTTLNTTPTDSDHWTTRGLAKLLGVSNATVARIWKSHGIKPKKKKLRKPAKHKRVDGNGSELRAVYFDPPIHALIVTVGLSSASRVRRDGDFGFSVERYPDEMRETQPDCAPCLNAALRLINGGLLPQNGSDPDSEAFGEFLRRIDAEIPRDHEIHVVLLHMGAEPYPDGKDVLRYGRFRVHAYPSESFREEALEDLVARSTGFSAGPGVAADVRDMISQIDRFVRGYEANPGPFVWIKRADAIREQRDGCKVFLETIRRLGWFMVNRMHSTWRHPQETPLHEEMPVKWKDKIESWFAAVAFAEQGEYETARQIAAAPIPEVGEVPRILPSFSTTFAAAAFAEENCHEIALEILSGTHPRNSFLEAVGLKGVQVRYGLAPARPSFAEVIGLAGARFQVVTMQL